MRYEFSHYFKELERKVERVEHMNEDKTEDKKQTWTSILNKP